MIARLEKLLLLKKKYQKQYFVNTSWELFSNRTKILTPDMHDTKFAIQHQRGKLGQSPPQYPALCRMKP
jgi:hypothetical protein